MDDTNEEEQLDISQTRKVCEVCGATFYRLSYVDYQYKLYFAGKFHFYCRYNCWRAAQKQQEERELMLKQHKRR